MNSIRQYYEKYHTGEIKACDYKSNQVLRDFFINTARTITDTFHPVTVLDAGCTLGFLVEELRKLGVQAYGMDPSENTIAQIDESVKDFCSVCPLQDELPAHFPKHFDLILRVQVINSPTKEEYAAAIQNLCSYTDRILLLFPASDDVDTNTLTFLTAELEKKHFFDHTSEYFPALSADAYCFEKDVSNHPLSDCEQHEKSIPRGAGTVGQKRTTFRESSNTMTNKQKTYFSASSHKENDSIPYPEATETSAALKRILFQFTVTRYLYKGIQCLVKNGIHTTLFVVSNKLQSKIPFNYCKITKKRRDFEEATVFNLNIKFSILVPLYNTPLNYLQEMIESVQGQTYKNWELCLADGSDEKHSAVEACVRQYAKNDGRIVYKKLEKNMGISQNTNRCLEMATGDYLALFDHDDILHPSVLFENMRVICEHNADFIYTDEATFEGENITKIINFHFKPDFAVDNLRANNYICHFSVFSKNLLEKAGLFRPEFDGSQDHDMILRLTANAKKIHHIPKLLYFWRSHPASVASDITSKSYAIDAGKNAVKESLKKEGYNVTIESSKAFPTIYRIQYELKSSPLISIIIPNRNHKSDLEKCVSSILEKSTYQNYEIIIVENGSTDLELFAYYKQLTEHENISVIQYSGSFNYSAVNNLGAAKSKGEYIILLNNDTEIITPDWIQELFMYAQRPDVGAVGAKLYYADNTVQHAGIVLGLGADGIAGHSHYGVPKDYLGYMGKLFYAQNMSAVTGACMMVRRRFFDEVGGLDETLKVAFNDVDLCLKLREKGYLIVFNPYAELYHYESKTRGLEDSEEKKLRFKTECDIFRGKWNRTLEKGDPYYNPNFSLKNDYILQFSKLKSDCRK